MISVDWSHTKQLTTFDGKKVRREGKAALLKRLKSGGESNGVLKSNTSFQPPAATDGESRGFVKSKASLQPSVVLEQGCPLSLVYSLLKTGASVSVISNRATQDYRVEHGVEKSDETDARLIYELTQNGAVLTPMSLTDNDMLLRDSYHQYCRFQKARVAMTNMRKAHLRHFGDAADLLPYDIAIDTLKAKEKSLQKIIDKALSGGGESSLQFESIMTIQPPPIRGLGNRLWGGLIVTANPVNFPCLSAYLRFCGLTADAIESHKYNRHATMLYHLLAEEIVRQRDATFRPLYDRFKAAMAVKYEGEKPYRINNAAMCRTATYLAKAVYRHCTEGAGESKE